MIDEEGATAEPELLVRYVAGVATDEEASQLEARLPVDEPLRLEVERLRELWNRTGRALDTPIPPERVDAAWLRLRAAAVGGRTFVPPRRPPRWPWRPRVIAASVLAAAAAVVLWIVVPHGIPSAPTPTTVAAAREFVAPAGSLLDIGLPDGSRVVLAPGSRLTAAVELAGSSRDVTLSGRARFTVAPDPARPFRVVAGGAVTQVLGTVFDVRAYPGASATEVVVESGKVAVRPAAGTEEQAHLLGRAQQAVVSEDGHVEVRADVDVDALLGWTSGTLAFRGTPLRDVIPELEGWFDIDIRLADPALGARRITATFEEEGKDVVLGAVAELVDATVQRAGREVVFAPFRSR